MESIFNLLKDINISKLYFERFTTLYDIQPKVVVINKYGDIKRDRNDIYIHQGKDAPYYFNERLTKINGYTLYKMKCNPDFDW